MDDLISRRAAIDTMEEYFARIGKMKRRGLNKGEKAIALDTVGAIKSLPSAEPKIIYCGECTKMKVDSVFHDCWCSETGKKVWINHYCGYAERREVTT